MSWVRGDKSLEVEVSRMQDWIEWADPDLYGNGRKGLIQQFWEDRSFVKGAVTLAVFFGGGDFVIQILRMMGLVK